MHDDRDDDLTDDEIAEPTPLHEPEPVPDAATVDAALGDPGAFVAGMTEAGTYSTFVPIPPNVLRALLGVAFAGEIAGIKVGHRLGSVVSSPDPAVIRAVRERFGKHDLPDNPGA